MILFFFTPLIRKAFHWAFFSVSSEHRAQRSVWEPLSPPIQAHHLFASLHYFWSRYSLKGGNDFGKQRLLLHRPYRQRHIKEISKQKREKASVSPEQNKNSPFFLLSCVKGGVLGLVSPSSPKLIACVRCSLELGRTAWQEEPLLPITAIPFYSLRNDWKL